MNMWIQMSVCVMYYLTQQQVNDMEDHVQRELGCEEREEPLRGVHMSLQAHIQEVGVQVWDVLLFNTGSDRRRISQNRYIKTGTYSRQSLKTTNYFN